MIFNVPCINFFQNFISKSCVYLISQSVQLINMCAYKIFCTSYFLFIVQYSLEISANANWVARQDRKHNNVSCSIVTCHFPRHHIFSWLDTIRTQPLIIIIIIQNSQCFTSQSLLKPYTSVPFNVSTFTVFFIFVFSNV